jgi:hypothetical protein
VCDAVDVHPDSHGILAVKPIIKAWTGSGFIEYTGEYSQHTVLKWVEEYSLWDEDEEAWPGVNGEEGSQVLSRGVLQAWEGQALPAQVFLPSILSNSDAGEADIQDGPPVIVFLHGGTDGAFHLNNQGGLAKILLENATFAASFPFIAIFPCSECNRIGGMAPFESDVYQGGSLTLGQMGWTPRIITRLDALIREALQQFGGWVHLVKSLFLPPLPIHLINSLF